MARFRRLTLAAVGLLAGMGIAAAQTPQDHTLHHPETPAPAPLGADQAMGMGPMMTMMPQMMGMMHGAMMRQAMLPDAGMGLLRVDRIEGRIAFLKAELAITDAQAPQWNAFADAVRSGAKELRTAMAAATTSGMPATAPARMEVMVTVMSARLGSLKTILAAATPLYAVLSDAQKATANELMGGHAMPGHHQRMGG